MSWRGIRKALDYDAILERMGLERRTPAGDVFTGLGLFSVGVLVGAGLGLMFAPKRGYEMRAALNDALRSRMRGAPELRHEMAPEAPPPSVAGH